MQDCPEQHCPVCGQRLAHFLRRRPGESTTAIGQAFTERGPKALILCDIDVGTLKWTSDGRVLVRFIEHEWPDAPEKTWQARFAAFVAALIDHAGETGFRFEGKPLHECSGVYVMVGAIKSDPSGGTQLGPQRCRRFGDAKDGPLPSEEDVFAWAEGCRGGRRRAAA